MANGFKHASQGSVLTQTEFEAEDIHVLDSQATGDIIYASSSSVLRRLAVGAENTTLQVSSGNIPEWVAAPTLGSGTTVGNITLANGSITDSSGAISFGDENLSTTGALSIASMGGNWTNASRTVADMGIVTTIDINGGTIDNAAIGGATPAAIAGTTGTFSGLITANGGITFAAGDDIAFTGSTGTNDIVLTNGLADALSITDGSADVIAISTAGATNTVAITGNLTVSGTIDADTAAVATTVTITDNDATNEANAITFTAGGDVDGGNIGLESDSDLTYNPSTGKITATGFIGALTGNADTATTLATTRAIAVAGDVTGTANFNGSAAISITTTLANDAIVTANITDANVTTAKIAADAITGAKIANDAIDSEHYAAGSIDNEHLADDAVDSDELAAGAVDTAHIADNQVTLAKIEDIARGSLIIGNASAATAELTKGADGYVLTSDGTDIAWAASTVGDITSIVAGTGLTGSSLTSGDATVNVIGGDGITANANDVAITAAQTTVTSVYNAALAVGYGASHANINFATDNQIIFDIDGTAQIELLDGILQPVTDVDINLGATDKRFQTLYGQQFHMDASVDGIGNNSYSGMSATLRVGDGAAVAAWDLVCISDLTNEVEVADADAVATSRVIGINPLNATISDNAEGVILFHGFVRNDAWGWTPGATLYLHTGGTGDTISATAPSGTDDCVVPIGVALEADMIYFNPSGTVIEHA